MLTKQTCWANVIYTATNKWYSCTNLGHRKKKYTKRRYSNTYSRQQLKCKQNAEVCILRFTPSCSCLSCCQLHCLAAQKEKKRKGKVFTTINTTSYAKRTLRYQIWSVFFTVDRLAQLWAACTAQHQHLESPRRHTSPSYLACKKLQWKKASKQSDTSATRPFQRPSQGQSTNSLLSAIGRTYKWVLKCQLKAAI